MSEKKLKRDEHVPRCDLKYLLDENYIGETIRNKQGQMYCCIYLDMESIISHNYLKIQYMLFSKRNVHFSPLLIIPLKLGKHIFVS